MIFEVYAKILPRGLTEAAARRFFSRFGEVISVTIRLSKDKNRTFGFIRFADLESCQRCVDSGPLMLENTRIHVQISSKCNAGQQSETVPAKSERQLNWGEEDQETATIKNDYYSCAGGPNYSVRSAEQGPAAPWRLSSGSLVCVVHLDKRQGIAYVQDAVQRRKLSELLADIREYNELNLLKPQSLLSGRSVLISVKNNLYRGKLIDDMNIDQRCPEDVQVYFTDLGRRAFVKPAYVLPMPDRFSHSDPLCSPVSLSGISVPTLCEIFKDRDYCEELFGSSLNLGQMESTGVKWFIVDIDGHNDHVPSVELSDRESGRCLNTTLRQYQQNDPADARKDHKRLDTNFIDKKPPEVNETDFVRDRPKVMACSLFRQGLQQNGEYVITHCDSLDSVFLCPSELLSKAMDACVDYSENLAGLKIEKSAPCKGELIMALYPVDDVWYRGEVKSIEKDAVSVFFVDFGNTEELSMSECHVLPDEAKGLAEIPIGLVECALRVPDKTSFDMSLPEKFTTVALHRSFKCSFGYNEDGKIELVEAIDKTGKSLHELLWGNDQGEKAVNGHASLSSNSDKSSENTKCVASEDVEGPIKDDYCKLDDKCLSGLRNDQISQALSLIRQGIESKRKFMQVIQEQMQAEERLLRKFEEALRLSNRTVSP